MTQRIIFSILFLVIVSLGSNKVSASGQRESMTGIDIHKMDMSTATKETSAPVKNMPVIPAPKPEVPHNKAAHPPHMEELPHIHRYHKERVKKVKQHHTKLWLIGQLLVVLCHISLLVIAYLHVIH